MQNDTPIEPTKANGHPTAVYPDRAEAPEGVFEEFADLGTELDLDTIRQEEGEPRYPKPSKDLRKKSKAARKARKKRAAADERERRRRPSKAEMRMRDTRWESNSKIEKLLGGDDSAKVRRWMQENGLYSKFRPPIALDEDALLDDGAGRPILLYHGFARIGDTALDRLVDDLKPEPFDASTAHDTHLPALLAGVAPLAIAGGKDAAAVRSAVRESKGGMVLPWASFADIRKAAENPASEPVQVEREPDADPRQEALDEFLAAATPEDRQALRPRKGREHGWWPEGMPPLVLLGARKAVVYASKADRKHLKEMGAKAGSPEHVGLVLRDIPLGLQSVHASIIPEKRIQDALEWTTARKGGRAIRWLDAAKPKVRPRQKRSKKRLAPSLIEAAKKIDDEDGRFEGLPAAAIRVASAMRHFANLGGSDMCYASRVNIAESLDMEKPGGTVDRGIRLLRDAHLIERAPHPKPKGDGRDSACWRLLWLR